MTRQLARIAVRHLARHPWQLGLAVLGIALGVAVAVSIDLANESARRAFSLATVAVTGRATHQVVGGPSGLPDDFYRVLKVDLGARLAAPVLSGDVATADRPGRTFTVLGVDPFAEAPFRPYLDAEGVRTAGTAESGSSPPGAAAGERRDPPPRDRLSTVAALVTRSGTILMARPTGRELGIGVGDRLAVRAAGIRRELTVAGLLDPGDEASARALDGLLVTDISTAQEIFGAAGRLGRIDLIVADDEAGRALLGRIAGALPPGAELVAAGARAGTTAQMIRAFQWNLTALSLLALVVGMFLIYQTMTFSVVQRRPLIGALRAIGVTRAEIFALVMTEAALIGVAGTAVGLGLALALARGLLSLVTRTINDLYFVVNVRQLALDPITLVKGIALGIGATLAAALPPALESTRVAPNIVLQRSTIESRLRQRLPLFGVVGALCSVLGVALFAFPSRDPFLAFAGLAAVLIGFALVSPLATYLLATGARPLLAKSLGLWGRMAARGVITSLSRTAIAVAALSIAVATTVGVSLMVSSFRGTVSRWLESSLIADVYATAPGLVSRRGEATIRAELVDRLRRAPGVQAITSVRTARVRWNEQPIDLVVTDLSAVSQRPYRFAEGNPEEIWPALESADAVAVSEPFAFHHRVEVGQSLDLTTDDGVRPFRIVGVYYDYGSDSGVVMINRKRYERHFRDRGITGLGFIATPGYSIDKLLSELRAIVGRDEQQLLLRSNRALRETSLQIFDRTFAITQVLRLLSVAVAFIGVLSALMALQLERARELAVMRAVGLLPRELRVLVTYQTGLMGLFAGLLSLPLGLLLAHILVHAINKRSFGWTLQLSLSPGIFVQALLVALGAALLAGVYPGWRMSRANPAGALRD